MEKLIKDVLDKYNGMRKKRVSHSDLAKLIVSHMQVGFDGTKGWYLNLNNNDGQHKQARDIIAEFGE